MDTKQAQQIIAALRAIDHTLHACWRGFGWRIQEIIMSKEDQTKPYPVWCEHLTHGGDGFRLMGEKPRITGHPKWQFCPLCGAPRPKIEPPPDTETA